MYGESDREQGEERAFDVVGQRKIGGERRCDGVRERQRGKGEESICEESPEGDRLERTDENKWTDGDITLVVD